MADINWHNVDKEKPQVGDLCLVKAVLGDGFLVSFSVASWIGSAWVDDRDEYNVFAMTGKGYKVVSWAKIDG